MNVFDRRYKRLSICQQVMLILLRNGVKYSFCNYSNINKKTKVHFIIVLTSFHLKNNALSSKIFSVAFWSSLDWYTNKGKSRAFEWIGTFYDLATHCLMVYSLYPYVVRFSSKLNYKLLKLDDNCILVTQYWKYSCCLVDAIHQCPKYYLQPKISMGQSKSYSRMGSKTMYCSRCLLNCLLDHSNNHLEFILKRNYYHLCC